MDGVGIEMRAELSVPLPLEEAPRRGQVSAVVHKPAVFVAADPREQRLDDGRVVCSVELAKPAWKCRPDEPQRRQERRRGGGTVCQWPRQPADPVDRPQATVE